MSVRFVLGRAGSGKTHHCLESIRAELEESSLGRALILLVPEQAAAQMERALLAGGNLAGTFRASVLSFRRLAYKVLAGAGQSRGIIPSVGERMILRHVLSKQQKRLKVYGDLAEKPGLINKLLENLKELIAEQVDAGQLQEAAKQSGNRQLISKAHDLAVLLEAYQEYVGRVGLERTGALGELAQRIGQTQWLAGARIWVDGFAGFSAQELAVLVELAGVCEQMDICLLLDPQDFQPGRLSGGADLLRLFGQTEQTYRRLSQTLGEAGVAVELPLKLAGAGRGSHPELAQLEANLFGAGQSKPREESRIRLIEAANRRSEVDAVVREILRLSRMEKDAVRYRQMAVIVRDLSAYEDLLAAGLAEHGIPFFIDRRCSLAHHALVELLAGALAVVIEDFSLAPMRALLKSGLLGIDQHRLDQLENYLLAHGVKGASGWAGEDWGYRGHMVLPGDIEEAQGAEDDDLAQINRTRREVMHRLSGWAQFAIGAEARPVKDWVRAMVQLLERMKVREQLAGWATQARQQGRDDLAQQHGRVWECLGELLEQMVEVLGAEQMELGELAELLNASMAEFTMGLVPPKLDQVLVGSVQRSRHPVLRAAFVIGMNEGLFPRTVAEDAVLSDRQRRELAEHELRLGPTAEELFFRERMLAYIALTRGRDYLWVSYAAADQAGKALRVSPFVDRLRAAVGGLQADRLGGGMDDPARATTRARLAGALAGRLRAGLEDTPDQEKGKWLGAYQWLAGRGQVGPGRRILSSLVYENKAYLDRQTAPELLGACLRTSKTGLESFAACPFQHFARRLLKLQERADARIQNVDLGRLYHRAMERLGQRLIEQNTRLAQMDREEAKRKIEGISTELVAQLAQKEPALQSGRNQFLAGYMQQHLWRAVAGGHFRSGLGELYPAAVEQAFGMDREGQSEASWPGLRFELGKGRAIELRGVIDLLELAKQTEQGRQIGYAVVYDYKRSRNKEFKLSKAYYGLDLQLLIYLLAVRHLAPGRLGVESIEPVGGFYVQLKAGVVATGKVGKEPSEEDLFSRSRPRGLYRADLLGLIEKTERGRLRAVHGTIKQDGNLSRSGGDWLKAEDFEKVLAFAEKEIRRLGHEILAGMIGVHPYRWPSGQVPCGYCEYRSLCRIDPLVDLHRELEITTEEEALEKMRQE